MIIDPPVGMRDHVSEDVSMPCSLSLSLFIAMELIRGRSHATAVSRIYCMKWQQHAVVQVAKKDSSCVQSQTLFMCSSSGNMSPSLTSFAVSFHRAGGAYRQQQRRRHCAVEVNNFRGVRSVSPQRFAGRARETPGRFARIDGRFPSRRQRCSSCSPESAAMCVVLCAR